VDNASTDGSAEMVRERFPQVKLIENSENVGFAKTNNQAIRESAGRYVLLLNSDAVVLLGAANDMVRFMDGHPEAGIAGAKLINEDSTFQASYADFPTLRYCG
jgi:GT2 family glycosyltransferase